MVNAELNCRFVFSHEQIFEGRAPACKGSNGFSGSSYSYYMVLRLLVYSIYRSRRDTIQVKSELIEPSISGLFNRVNFWIILNSTASFTLIFLSVRKNRFLELTRLSLQEENSLVHNKYNLNSDGTNQNLLSHQVGESGGITHYE